MTDLLHFSSNWGFWRALFPNLQLNFKTSSPSLHFFCDKQPFFYTFSNIGQYILSLLSLYLTLLSLSLSLSLSSSLSIYQLYQDTLSHQYHLKYHRWFDLFLSTFRFFHIFGSGKWFWFSIVMQSRPLYAICIYRHDVFSSVIEPQVVYMLNQKFFPVAMEKKYFSWKKSFSWIQLFLLYWKKNIFSECAEFSSLIHLFNVVLIAL